MKQLALLPFVALSLLSGCVHATDAASSDEQGVTAIPSCDARAFGAKGDGVTKDTKAIQAAIDACAGKGGEVHLQNGTFLSGMIVLKSSMTLHVHGGATLKGSLDDVDYPDTNPATDNSQLSNCKKALVYAEGAKDLHITGTGVIDGGGDAAKWGGSSKQNPERTRPMAVFIVLSQNVTIEDVTVKNSAMWGLVNMETDNLTIRGVTVDSTHGSTRDGMDIVDCHHVLVENSTVSSGDDSFCLKSGVARGVDDVTIRNSKVLTSGVANALKLGTASYGAFTNITFDTIDLQHADKAAMAVESVDGSLIQNVVFRNITFHDVGTPFFVLIGDRGVRPARAPRKIGTIDGVRFESITGDTVRHDWGAIVSGLSQGGQEYKVSNVVFQDVKVTMRGGLTTVPVDPPEYKGEYPDPNLWGESPASGVYLRHADGVTFTNTAIDVSPADARPLTVAVDVTNFAAPACDVTFTVRTDLNAPAYDPGTDAFRILGRTTPPTGIGTLAADAISDWKATLPGLNLVQTTSDPTGRFRFTGHASFPQGATLDFKTVVGEGAALRYERVRAGNRQLVVPVAPTATVDIDWEN
jgi:Glycosyl hydrolases family 28